MTLLDGPSFKWSDLARESGAVGAALDEHGTVLVQRGRDLLQLGPVPPHSMRSALAALCRLLTSVAETTSPEQVAPMVEAAWPWTQSLTTIEKYSFAVELRPQVEVSESLGTWEPLVRSIDHWQRQAAERAANPDPEAHLSPKERAEAAAQRLLNLEPLHSERSTEEILADIRADHF